MRPTTADSPASEEEMKSLEAPYRPKPITDHD